MFRSQATVPTPAPVANPDKFASLPTPAPVLDLNPPTVTDKQPVEKTRNLDEESPRPSLSSLVCNDCEVEFLF